LFRTHHEHAVASTVKHSINSFSTSVSATWKLSENLGRRYAKVSGDFNPIHLTKWSAKLFGFNQHIIRGMWTKAYCISALQKINPSRFLQNFEVNTTFKQPLYLPCQVNMEIQTFESEKGGDEQHFKVLGIGANKEQQPTHLIGSIRTI
jgi:acyl dehydratase